MAVALAIVSVSLVLGGATNATAADPCLAGGNPISCENSKPGTDPSVWDIDGAGDDSIQGFSTDISVNVGQPIGFKIKTTAAAYSITIYRTGWYGGLGARQIATVTPSAPLPQIQPQCLSDVTTQLYDCGTWGLSATWNVPSTAVSGVYVALLTRKDTGGKSQIVFVVRNDASHSDVVFQTSDPTWQAYNTYGGADFYQGADIGRAFKISYNRPVVTRGDVDGRDFYFSSEFAMVRFMEQNGYDVSYLAGVDSDRYGGLLKNHKVFLSVGHDEYWSGGQRANIEAAGAAGVNLQFLSGNDDYWRTRYEPSTTDNTSYRTITSYKETWSNAKIDPSPQWTGTWRDPRFASPANGGGIPENALSGTMYMSNFTDLPITVNAAEGKTRLWRNTSLAQLAAGTQAALAPHTIGYESNEDVDNGFRPQGLIRLSTTVGPTPQYMTDYGNVVQPGTTTHNLTLYKNAAGALIFSAGSVQWSWGLDATHDGDGAPADPRMRQAEVNLLADMGAQPTTLDPTLVLATKSTDTTAPVAVITSPANGASIANGATVTVTGTATDVGGVVAGVELSTDGGTSWRPATGKSRWTYSYVQHGVGAVPLLARAIDDSANYPATPTQVTLQVGGPYSAFGTTVPVNADSGDTSSVTVGLRFTPNQSGFVSGVRFYKSAANTGTHTGILWTSAGVQLASVTFANESASGWQSAKFVSPVQVTAGQSYVVSYSAPNGHYSYQSGYWDYRGTTAAPLSIAGGFGAAPAGVYNTGGTFPTDSYEGSNYFVDAIFETTDTSPLSATAQVPAAGSSSVAANTPISAVLSKDVTAGSVSISLATTAGAAVAGTTTYNPSTRTASFAPAGALTQNTGYTATIAATAGGASVTSGATWKFTTVLPDAPVGSCPCSLYQDSTTPTVLSIADGTQLSLGVKFSPTATGTITGIKFYKGPGNTGTHTGTLYSVAGAVLATATFTAESTTGWQTAMFASPVAVTAGTEYIASYTNPVGTYSATPGAYSSDVNTGPLHVTAGQGQFSYTSNFPTNTSSSSYLVDVVFNPTFAPLTAGAQQPAAGASSVPVGTTLSTVFSKAVTATTVNITLKTTAGVSVPGTTSYDPVARVATFTPSAVLANATGYTATASATATSGEGVSSGAIWSITTARVDSPAGTCPCSLYQDSTVPSVLSIADGTPLSLGVKFSANSNGTVTGITFYKGPGNTGTHKGTLYSTSGTALATGTFTSETAAGWQTLTFATPVAITAGTEYVASYTNPAGTYSANPGGFGNDVNVGPLHVPAGQGQYAYSSDFPNNASSSSYLVDVLFQPAVVIPPLTTTSVSPPSGALDQPLNSTVSATFSAPLAAGYAMNVTAGSTAVSGTVAASNSGKTLTFTPSANLPTDTLITVTLSNLVSSQGATLANTSWTFRSLAPASTSTTLFGALAPQVQANADDTSPIELGVSFTPSTAGTATAIRFFKGAGNSGTHTGSIWDSAGNRLATVTFSNETATGWQTALLSTPLPLAAGTTYTVSYYAPNGCYSSTGAFFGSNYVAGPLTVAGGSNGLYLYGTGGGMPIHAWNSTNYFVDVVFTTGN
ncbi:DUF4082 domain-containing protein [Arthrobacter sp. GMC3]|uniref:DUF4082 domain-containing protein n=1 Tax=Arthrobacter sp. GMC3 TaxID=2058894 RepID=UPI000CE35EDA|nr:DUF4082 domain-containing protein [Arthrobacter sp. GMC3]